MSTLKPHFSAILLAILAVSANGQSRSDRPTVDGSPADRQFGWSLKVEPKVLKRDTDRPIASKKRSESTSSDEIQIDTQLVLSDILVQDKKGNPVQGLRTSDFEIKEDGRTQSIDVFTHGDSSVPRSIFLIIDHSLSQWRHIERSITAAKVLVDSLRPADRMAIISDDVEMITDLTSDKAVLKERLESLRAKCSGGSFGKSRQYSALFAALNERIERNGTRNIVILQTDGDELSMLRSHRVRGVANFSVDDIIDAAERKGVTVYTVFTGARLGDISKREMVDHTRREIADQILALTAAGKTAKAPKLSYDYLLARAERLVAEEVAVGSLAERTGGIAQSLELPEQAAAVYERILTDIGRRYLVGYYPAERSDGSDIREVRITVKNKGSYRVVGGRTYVAY
jgi:VWFA-related protein